MCYAPPHEKRTLKDMAASAGCYIAAEAKVRDNMIRFGTLRKRGTTCATSLTPWFQSRPSVGPCVVGRRSRRRLFAAAQKSGVWIYGDFIRSSRCSHGRWVLPASPCATCERECEGPDGCLGERRTLSVPSWEAISDLAGVKL